MKYLAIYKADIANGVGFRVSLFVAGCNRHCKGCFNPESWDPDNGRPFDDAAKKKIFRELERPWCRGLSIVGGEPLSVLSDNREQVIALAKQVKEKYPGKDLWLFTSYQLDEIRRDPELSPALELFDVIKTGPFIQELKDPALAFAGSRNQSLNFKGRDY